MSVVQSHYFFTLYLIHECSLYICQKSHPLYSAVSRAACLTLHRLVARPAPGPPPSLAPLRSCRVIYSSMRDKGMACYMHFYVYKNCRCRRKGACDVTKVPKPMKACLPATRCVQVTELKSHYLDVGRVNLLSVKTDRCSALRVVAETFNINSKPSCYVLT